MTNQNGNSKTDLVVKLLLVFFISLFSFSVGTFVGKQFSDSEKRQAELESDYKETRSIASAHGDNHTDKSVTDEDVAALSKEFVKEEQDKASGHHDKKDTHAKMDEHGKKGVHAKKSKQAKKTKSGFQKFDRKKDTHVKKETHGKKADTKPKAKKPTPSAKSKKEKVSPVAQKIIKGQSPTKSIKKKRKPSSVLPSFSNAVGRWTVQVASYSSEKEATVYKSKLVKNGYSAFYVTAKIKGRSWYRVSVGLFDNRKSAGHFRKELLKEKFVKAAIIQKIVK